MPDKVSAAGTIPQYSDTFLVDNTRPAKLAVDIGVFGVFRLRTNSNVTSNPLVLFLSNVEPNCRLEYMSISGKPDADWETDAKPLPANLMRCLDDGRYALILGKAEADKLGLKPGHIFEIRQKDGADNEGDPTRITLDQKAIGKWAEMNLDKRTRDQLGVNLPAGAYLFLPDTDVTPPVVLTRLMRIDAKNESTAILEGKKAVEPGCTIVVFNARTKKEFKVTADANGKFKIEFEAKAGDPLHLRVFDHNKVCTDLGLTPYAPKCVQAGPLAQKELQDATKG